MQDAADAPLMLSVSGARGVIGASMTADVARRFATAFASVILERSSDTSPVVVIGRDTRPSGEELARAAIEGLASAGCAVIDLGVAMTPSVGVMVTERKAASGMVITASHNQAEWNGLKCLTDEGTAPRADVANRIIARFHERKPASAKPASAGLARPSLTRDSSASETHIARVLAALDPEPIRRAKFKVVLDSINGAGCAPGRGLLEDLGCEVIHINKEPNGEFAHTPEPTEENLHGTAKVVAREKAHIGFAQDPDGDRLALIDESGTYVGEEYTLALCALRVLEMEAGPEKRSAEGPGRSSLRTLTTNLSTSRMIDDIAARYSNVRIVRTPVGEANVVAAMMEQQTSGHRAILGGEGNGGVIYPRVCMVRDSLSAMALVLDLMAQRQRPLSEIVAELPRYHMIKTKFDLSALGGPDAVPAILDHIKRAFTSETINDTDGVRIDFPDGWVHVRPSNTEPIVRLIAEGRSAERAAELVARVRAAAACK